MLVTGSQGYYKKDAGGKPISLSPDNVNLVKLWEPEAARLIRGFSEELFHVYQVSASYDRRYIAAAAAGQKIRIWQLNTGELVLAADLPPFVASIAFNPANNTFAFNMNNAC